MAHTTQPGGRLKPSRDKASDEPSQAKYDQSHDRNDRQSNTLKVRTHESEFMSDQTTPLTNGIGSPDKTAGELERIAKHLDELKSRLESLEQENKLLHDRQEALVAERASLVERNEEARSRVEGMIERLKALELAGIG